MEDESQLPTPINLPSVRLTLNACDIQSYLLLFVATIMLKNPVKALNLIWYFMMSCVSSQFKLKISGNRTKISVQSYPLEEVNLTHCGLVSSDAIWQQRSGSTLTQVMACCLTAPSHYLKQCWLIISKVHWHVHEGNFTRDISAISH